MIIVINPFICVERGGSHGGTLIVIFSTTYSESA